MARHDQHRGRPGQNQPSSQPPARQDAPYHFVPVVPAAAVDDQPIYHDTLDLAERWTGELHCTLTVQTPLLAANDQYAWPKARNDLRDAFEALATGRFGARCPNR